MKCKIRFFNAIRAEEYGRKLTAVDKVILLRSTPHVHVEFQFSERYVNISFSATMQDNAKCCRFKEIDYTENPERWDTIILNLTDKQEDAAYAKAKELEGKDYDLFGLLSFTSEVNIVKPDPNKYWCSEAAMELIVAAAKVIEQSICPANNTVKTFIANLRPDHYTPTGLFYELISLIANPPEIVI